MKLNDFIFIKNKNASLLDWHFNAKINLKLRLLNDSHLFK